MGLGLRYRLCLAGLALLWPAFAWSTPVADLVRVDKGQRKITLFRAGEAIASFDVALGRDPVGAKQCQGDNRTPEGEYVIERRLAQSRYHRALKVSYPAASDVARARQAGCKPGGDIMIHGLRNGGAWLGRRHLLRDWTRGCIAVTNEEIERIWALVPDGTKVVIAP